MANNLIVAQFADSSKSYELLSFLKNASAAGRLTLLDAVVVKHDPSGKYLIQDGQENTFDAGALTGTLVGSLIGILGGPLGMLFGAGAGTLLGSAADIDRDSDAQSVLAQVSAIIPVGATALVADLDEVAVEVVNSEVSRLGGVVFRWSQADVQVELDAQKAAQDAASREASRVLYEKHKADVQQQLKKWGEEVDADIQKVKDFFNQKVL